MAFLTNGNQCSLYVWETNSILSSQIDVFSLALYSSHVQRFKDIISCVRENWKIT